VSEVFWKRQKPDQNGIVWNDLIDPRAAKSPIGAKWVITYRDYPPAKWHVMWNIIGHPEKTDQLIAKTITEAQLRENLRLEYILIRGEANNVR